MSAKKLPRVVIDTNVLVSGIMLQRGFPYELIEMWRAGTFKFITSRKLRDELEDVLQRPRFQQQYPIRPEYKTEIMTLLAKHASVVVPLATLPVEVRDPKDAMVLGTALRGRADYLVSGDKDLLVLKDEPALVPLRIVTAREFVNILALP